MFALSSLPTPRPSPPTRRLVPLAVALGLYVVLCLALRAGLFWTFGRREGAGFGEAARVFLSGLRMDLTVGVIVLLPVAAWLLLVPERIFAARAHRLLVHAGFLLALVVLPFTLAIEWYFFEEFDARFNTVAVDYLLFPQEVAGNIRDSYPLGTVIGACVLAGLVLWALVRRAVDVAWHSEPAPLAPRLRDASVLLGLAALAAFSVRGAARPFPSRVLNELSDNGVHSFAHAVVTRDLDYTAYYETLPHEESWSRTRRLVAGGEGRFTRGGDLERIVPGDSGRPHLNVVVVLEESLGSEFWGSLGRPGTTCTPEMDRLCAEGTLFSAMHATGNRTVRGMEGVLASFPPLPGDSIVRRSRSQHVETIARVLKRDGYDTAFVYGGRGLFDDMRSFTTANGWDRFIEQKDFSDPAHVTVWGVSDEDIFARCLDEMKAMRATGRPFLLTALTVSNHKPFTYPAGRISPPAEFRRRERAVMYADWAVARFLEQARAAGFWNDTVIAVVADHGARVYGSQDIPMKSYEIPFVLFGPDGVVEKGARVSVPGSSIDVAPTVLGRVGRPYRTVFFGRDLLAPGAASSPGLIPLHHDRDIGLLREPRLAVLTLGKQSEVYGLSPEGLQDAEPLPSLSSSDDELLQDARAIFQVADEVYTSGRYRVAADGP